MTNAIKKPLFLFALVLLCLALSHSVYAKDTYTLCYQTASGGGYVLSVEGLDGTQNVYAVQLELAFSTDYPDAQLVATDPTVYSTVNNSQNRLNIYITALSPINDGSNLVLGTLYPEASGSFSMPSSARLIMLGADLSPITGDETDKSSTVSVRSVTAGSSSSSGASPGAASRNSITIRTVSHGTVKSSVLSAQAGVSVQLTVTAESGYELGSLRVTDADGNEITLLPERSGVYSFRMPDSAVEVIAQFIIRGPASDEPDFPFSDVGEDDWYFGAVRYVYENGMMTGTGDGLFSPGLTTSRAMIVTILYRLEDGPAPMSAIFESFSDVQADAWYAGAVAWAGKNSVVSGYDDGRFGPDDAITREQLAAILYRYVSLKGLDVSASASLDSFTDASSVSSYADEAMRWAVGSGLISGKGNNILDPLGSATRAEAAAILMRFCQSA